MSSSSTTTSLSFSSMPPKRKIRQQQTSGESGVDDFDDDNNGNNPHRQPFVTSKLEPGEWDIDRTDPYYRPKPPTRSRLITAEDFANRPPVGFENEFSTYNDSMITLSWLDTKTCRQIYQQYVDMMVKASTTSTSSGSSDGSNDNASSGGRTSHEYVIRVLAQRFKITPLRAAGVVQLQHNEEQMRWHQPHLICDEQADYAEKTIQDNIQDAYNAERTDPPGTRRVGGGGGRNNRGPRGNQGQLTVVQPYVEDPVGIHGRGESDEISRTFVGTDDIYDMDKKVQDANTRDIERGRILLDEHVYVEDVDDTNVSVKTDGTAKRLLKSYADNTDSTKDSGDSSDGSDTKTTTTIPYPERNSQGDKRPRWKYVAQVVNTRDQRKKGRRLTSYVNDRMENTLVEQDGTLRVATVSEAKHVAWKPNRRRSKINGRRNNGPQMEAIYEDVKEAWLQRTLQGKTDVWGKAPNQMTAAIPTAAAEAAEEEDSTADDINASAGTTETELDEDKDEGETSSDDSSDSSDSSDDDDDDNGDADADASSDSDDSSGDESSKKES